jgi:hypothetical protein
MFDLATVPEPFCTAQDCPVGAVTTVTSYAAPVLTALGSVNTPLLLTDSFSSLLLSRMRTVPGFFKPMTVPPIVYVRAASETSGVATVAGELGNSAQIAVPIVRNEIENQRMTTPKTNAALLIVLAPIII